VKYAGEAGVLLGKAALSCAKAVYFVGETACRTASKAAQRSRAAAKAGKTTRERSAERPRQKARGRRPGGRATYVPLSELKANGGSVDDFCRYLEDTESTIGIILGARGTGKSAIGMRLLENMHAKTGRAVYAMGFRAEDVPGWISVVEDPDQVKNNAYVLIDEGGVLFSSRKAMSQANQLLSALLLVARHKGLSILFISQNSSNLDVNILRQADFLVMKPCALLQLDFERKKIKDLYGEIAGEFEELKREPGATYLHADSFQGFAANSLPSFWNREVSRAFR